MFQKVGCLKLPKKIELKKMYLSSIYLFAEFDSLWFAYSVWFIEMKMSKREADIQFECDVKFYNWKIVQWILYWNRFFASSFKVLLTCHYWTLHLLIPTTSTKEAIIHTWVYFTQITNSFYQVFALLSKYFTKVFWYCISAEELLILPSLMGAVVVVFFHSFFLNDNATYQQLSHRMSSIRSNNLIWWLLEIVSRTCLKLETSKG